MSSTNLRRMTPDPVEVLPPKVKTMARPKLTDKHVLFIRLADELVSNIARGGDLERSLVRDIRELDDDKRALTLDYAVKALLTTRK